MYYFVVFISFSMLLLAVLGMLFAKGRRRASFFLFLATFVGGGALMGLLKPNDPEVKPSTQLPKIQGSKNKISDGAYIVRAEEAVTAILTDPGSARFRNVNVYRKPNGAVVVCGEVNARNRMGGYNGYETFLSGGFPQTTVLESQIKAPALTIRSMCRSDR